MAVSDTYVSDVSRAEPRRAPSGELVFIWVAIALALAFWLSYFVFVEGAMLGLI